MNSRDRRVSLAGECAHVNVWTVTISAFAMMALGFSLAALIGTRLPETRNSDGSPKNLRTSVAIVATMSSLLLGLMVNSARYNYRDAYSDVQRYASVIQMLDIELRNYGAAACPIRSSLEDNVRKLIAETWNSHEQGGSANVASQAAVEALLRFDGQVRALPMTDAEQHSARSTILALSRQLVEYRWKVTGAARTATPVVFIAVVICWFAFIFAYAGVFAPINAFVFTAHFLAMGCISAAIFLVMELGAPFSGPMQVSPAPIEELLEYMKKDVCPAVARAG